MNIGQSGGVARNEKRFIKVVCINKNDTDLEYLKIYDAEEFIPVKRCGLGATEYMVYVEDIDSKQAAMIQRSKSSVISFIEYRNQQIDKIIE